MLNWYALNSKPHCELVVYQGLTSRGIRAYLPVWGLPRYSRRTTRPRPYFPGYLFAQADLETVGLSALQYLFGVRSLVFSGDRPARIPEMAIAAVARRLAEFEDCEVDAAGQPLAKGDRVEVTAGPFQGYEAIFDKRVSPDERVRLFIEFTNRLTPLEIERELIRKKVPFSFRPGGTPSGCRY